MKHLMKRQEIEKIIALYEQGLSCRAISNQVNSEHSSHPTISRIVKENGISRTISEALKGKPKTKEHKKNMRVTHPSHSGERHHSWKGGTTPLIIKIRRCFQYRLWVSDVLKRDDWTCQECVQRGYRLEAHHVKEFATIISEYKIKTFQQAINCAELWDIDNGLTLCKECHMGTQKR